MRIFNELIDVTVLVTVTLWLHMFVHVMSSNTHRNRLKFLLQNQSSTNFQ